MGLDPVLTEFASGIVSHQLNETILIHSKLRPQSDSKAVTKFTTDGGECWKYYRNYVTTRRRVLNLMHAACHAQQTIFTCLIARNALATRRALPSGTLLAPKRNYSFLSDLSPSIK